MSKGNAERRFGKFDRLFIAVSLLAMGGAVAINAASSDQEIDHVVRGSTIRDGKEVDYLAGLLTTCNEQGVRPAVINITARLVTHAGSDGSSERGRQVVEQFTPGEDS